MNLIPISQLHDGPIKLGPFVSPAGAELTSLTITQSDVLISKNHGPFVQKQNATDASHDQNGFYDVPTATKDWEVTGIVTVSVNMTGAVPFSQQFLVLPAFIHDQLLVGEWPVWIIEMLDTLIHRAGVPASEGGLASDIAQSKGDQSFTVTDTRQST